jgi:hypothetical protein
MKNSIITISIVSSVIFVSCKLNDRECATQNFQKLGLHAANSTMLLPPFKILDSIRYDPEVILNYSIKTLDTSLSVVAFVYSDAKGLFTKPINDLRDAQKQEVEYGRDSIRLLEEKVKTIGSIKVGYLKYHDFLKKRNEGRFFYFNQNKMVIIWLFEPYANEKLDNSSLIECVFENLDIK